MLDLMLVHRTRINVIYVCPLFSAISVFSLVKFKFKFEKEFFNLEIINGGGQLIISAFINGNQGGRL
jgi:hypothetical protein